MRQTIYLVDAFFIPSLENHFNFNYIDDEFVAYPISGVPMRNHWVRFPNTSHINSTQKTYIRAAIAQSIASSNIGTDT